MYYDYDAWKTFRSLMQLRLKKILQRDHEVSLSLSTIQSHLKEMQAFKHKVHLKPYLTEEEEVKRMEHCIYSYMIDGSHG